MLRLDDGSLLGENAAILQYVGGRLLRQNSPQTRTLKARVYKVILHRHGIAVSKITVSACDCGPSLGYAGGRVLRVGAGKGFTDVFGEYFYKMNRSIFLEPVAWLSLLMSQQLRSILI